MNKLNQVIQLLQCIAERNLSAAITQLHGISIDHVLEHPILAINSQFTYDERPLITSSNRLSIDITPLPYHAPQQMQEKSE